MADKRVGVGRGRQKDGQRQRGRLRSGDRHTEIHRWRATDTTETGVQKETTVERANREKKTGNIVAHLSLVGPPRTYCGPGVGTSKHREL